MISLKKAAAAVGDQLTRMLIEAIAHLFAIASAQMAEVFKATNHDRPMALCTPDKALLFS